MAAVAMADAVLAPDPIHVRVPLGAVHRLDNPGIGVLWPIKIQTGNSLGDGDILRHENRCHRGLGA